MSMSEDAAPEAPETVETPDEQESESGADVSRQDNSAWWRDASKEDITSFVNDKVQKRLAREKAKYDPLVQEHAKLKAEVERLKPLEDANKTDLQRWEDERANLAKELEEHRAFRAQQERNNLVREIADEKGLPTRFINRVQGDDADSITADIDDLLTVLNDGKPTKPASRKPVDPDEKPGGKGYGGGGSKSDTDDKAVVDNVIKKFREQRNRTFAR